MSCEMIFCCSSMKLLCCSIRWRSDPRSCPGISPFGSGCCSLGVHGIVTISTAVVRIRLERCIGLKTGADGTSGSSLGVEGLLAGFGGDVNASVDARLS